MERFGLPGEEGDEEILDEALGGPFRGVEVIEDLRPGRGPLGGLATVLASVETDWVLVLDDPAAGYAPPGLKKWRTE